MSDKKIRFSYPSFLILSSRLSFSFCFVSWFIKLIADMFTKIFRIWLFPLLFRCCISVVCSVLLQLFVASLLQVENGLKSKAVSITVWASIGLKIFWNYFVLFVFHYYLITCKSFYSLLYRTAKAIFLMYIFVFKIYIQSQVISG